MNAPTPLDMAASRRLVQILRIALMVSVGLYAFLVWRIPGKTNSLAAGFYFGIAAMAAVTVLIMFAIRRAMLSRAEAILSSNPNDAIALARWRAAHTISYALCESIALYGVVLHFVGADAGQVAPILHSRLSADALPSSRLARASRAIRTD